MQQKLENQNGISVGSAEITPDMEQVTFDLVNRDVRRTVDVNSLIRLAQNNLSYRARTGATGTGEHIVISSKGKVLDEIEGEDNVEVSFGGRSYTFGTSVLAGIIENDLRYYQVEEVVVEEPEGYEEPDTETEPEGEELGFQFRPEGQDRGGSLEELMDFVGENISGLSKSVHDTASALTSIESLGERSQFISASGGYIQVTAKEARIMGVALHALRRGIESGNVTVEALDNAMLFRRGG